MNRNCSAMRAGAWRQRLRWPLLSGNGAHGDRDARTVLDNKREAFLAVHMRDNKAGLL